MASNPFGSLYERKAERTNQIIDAAVNAIKNASLPPTFESINNLIKADFGDFNEDDADTLKEVLPVFYGPTNMIRGFLNFQIDDDFPLHLLLLILEFKGPDILEIYYGKTRRLGKQLKDVFEQCNQLDVRSYATREPSHNIHSAFQGIAEKRFLSDRFSVYMNGAIVYLGECSPKVVMPVFNTIVQFETSPEQAEILGKWNTYISKFRSFKEVPIPVRIEVPDSQLGVEESVRNWLEEAGLNVTHFEVVQRTRIGDTTDKLYLAPDPRGVKSSDRLAQVALPIEIGDETKSMCIGEILQKFYDQGTNRTWNPELRQLGEMREEIMKMVTWFKVRLATIMCEGVIFPSPDL